MLQIEASTPYGAVRRQEALCNYYYRLESLIFKKIMEPMRAKRGGISPFFFVETCLNPLLRRAIVVYRMGISLFLNRIEQRKAAVMPPRFARIRPILPGKPCRAGRFLTGLFFCAFFSVALGMMSASLHAEEPPPPASTTQIVTDQERGTVTIVIDGKPVVQIDKDGLRVVGNVEYGGTLTDTGSAYVEKAIAGGDDAR